MRWCTSRWPILRALASWAVQRSWARLCQVAISPRDAFGKLCLACTLVRRSSVYSNRTEFHILGKARWFTSQCSCSSPSCLQYRCGEVYIHLSADPSVHEVGTRLRTLLKRAIQIFSSEVYSGGISIDCVQVSSVIRSALATSSISSVLALHSLGELSAFSFSVSRFYELVQHWDAVAVGRLYL